MKCIKDRCFSPVACGGFGYCREINMIGELRDYFAGKALPHALARERHLIDRYGDKVCEDHVLKAAREAYRIADEMLKARGSTLSPAHHAMTKETDQ